jgi:hypothetical protein
VADVLSQECGDDGVLARAGSEDEDSHLNRVPGTRRPVIASARS